MDRLYPTLLGSRWAGVAPAVKQLHDRDAESTASGAFRVDHGKRRGVRSVVRWLKLPGESRASPVRLVIGRDGGGETWRRHIGDSELITIQSATPGGLLLERYGPLEFWFRMSVVGSGLSFEQTAAAIRLGKLRLRLPRWLSPSIEAREDAGVRSGEVQVSVWIQAPWLGRLIAYSGTVEVAGPCA